MTTQSESDNTSNASSNASRLVIIAVVTLLIAAGAWWLVSGGTTSSGSGRPQLAVDRDMIDLGTLPYSQRVSAVFEIKNVGTDTLHVLEQPGVELVEGC